VAVCLGGLVIAQQRSSETDITPPADYEPAYFRPSAELSALLRQAVDDVITTAGPGKFAREDIAATLVDLRDPHAIGSASVNGTKRFYPASVVKLFYMVALERQLKDGKIVATPELERGLRDMIVDSSNEATQYILDVLTDTASGGELPAAEFAAWSFRRNRVNRFFTRMGYANINVNQKTFCEDAYGREQQFRNYRGENRNMLTTDATARLLTEIVLGRVADKEDTAKMMELLKRDPFADTKDPDDQAHAFSGKALVERKLTGARLWSKAGWVSKERHDAAYIETATGNRFVLVVFTQNHGNEKGHIPALAGKIIDGLGRAGKTELLP
jgi:beta-lactamase class A